jgi:glycine cleavage system regulatory protein
MHASLVMTVIGKDRTGLVESVAKLVTKHGGNWLESRMCKLGGEFAGILRVEVPADRQAALKKALSALPNLTVVIRPEKSGQVPSRSRLVTLELVGQDRPGIVSEITHTMAAQGVNVEELATECVSAPMSGESLFRARARLRLPASVTLSGLRESLEKAASDLTVEVGIV